MQPDRLDRWIPRLMVLVVLAVAFFAFTESYTHIFYLAQAHHETGTALRMLPLSVDLIMVGAGLVMLHLKRKDIRHPLPRVALWGGASVTLAANVGFGIFYGWLAALISAWAPVALFVAVELGMLLVRTAKAEANEAKPQIVATFQDGHGNPIDGTMTVTPEPEAVDSPGDSLQGWGQLGRPEPASGGLTGIGLSNGRK